MKERQPGKNKGTKAVGGDYWGKREREWNDKRMISLWMTEDASLKRTLSIQGIQSAKNTLYSPGPAAFLSEIQTSLLPSGENIGKLLKWPWDVSCSNPDPSS